MNEQRRQAPWRRRQIIFNNDDEEAIKARPGHLLCFIVASIIAKSLLR